MNIKTVSAIVAALGVTAIAGAQQQLSDYAPANVSVRIGGAFPIEQSLSNVTSNLIALGFEYQLPRSLFAGGDTYIALDWWTRSFLSTSDRVSPLTLNQRFYGGSRGHNRRTYSFIGAGIAFVDFGASDQSFCFRGGFGVELGEATFGEFAAVIGDKAAGVRPNAITFSVGYRF